MMMGDALLLGLFDDAYVTPASRTILLPLIRRPIRLPNKFTAEYLDYKLDWSLRLLGDTIETAEISTISGAVVVSRTAWDDTTASFWIAGGRSGNGSLIECLITTVGGRELEEVLPIRCF